MSSSEYEFKNVLSKWKSRFDNDYTNKCNWENEKINIIESDENLIQKYISKYNDDKFNMNKVINYLENNNDELFNNLMFKNQVLIIISNNLELIYNLYKKLKEKYSSKKILDDLMVCYVDEDNIYNFRSFFSIGSSKMKFLNNINIDLNEYKNYNIISDDIIYNNCYYIHYYDNILKHKLENYEFIDNGYYIGKINMNSNMEETLVENPLLEIQRQEKLKELGLDKYIDKIKFKDYPKIKFKNIDKYKSTNKKEGKTCILNDGNEIFVKGNLSDIIEVDDVKDFEIIMKIYEKNMFYFIENKKECKVKKKILIENDGKIKYIKKSVITKLDENNPDLIKNLKKYLIN